MSSLNLTQSLVQTIQEQIEHGRLKPNDKLLSIRQCALHHKISTFTVMSAYDRLSQMGLIKGESGRGYFVQASIDIHQASFVSNTLSDLPVDDDWLLQHIYHPSDDAQLLGCGWLPQQWFHPDTLTRALRNLARRPIQGFSYGDPLGYAPLRVELAMKLQKEHLPIQANNLILTQGASKALEMIASSIIPKGATVLIDEPGYCNLISHLRFQGFKVIGIPWTEQGPDLQLLEQTLAQHSIFAFFTNPNLHNPTGASYSLDTAHAVVRLCQSHKVLIIEDQVSIDLCLNTPLSLCAIDGLRYSIYVGSFSKSLNPSLRVGYLAAPSQFMSTLERYKMITGLTTPVLNEQLILQLIQDQHATRQLKQLRAKLHHAQNSIQTLLKKHNWQIFTEAQSGLFVYAKHPVIENASRLAIQCHTQGVQLAPGRLFMPNAQEVPYLRFNVAQCQTEFFEQWLNYAHVSST